MSRPTTPIVLTLVVLCLVACNDTILVTEVTDHPRYHSGQTWRYRTRPGEETSTALVLRVDRHRRSGVIVHVRVLDVRISGAQGVTTTVVGHLPLSEAAFTASALALVSTGQPLSDPGPGYYQWRSAFETGAAGIFKQSLAEALTSIEEASRNPVHGKA